MANPILDAFGTVLPLLEKVAPTIATALGGPLAGTAVTFLERELGSPGAGAPSVAAALASPNPDQLAAIRKADNDFALAMRNLDISVDKQADDDRASARAREVAMKDLTPTVLAYVLTAGLFGLITLLTWKGFPTDNGAAQPLNLILGSIATAWVGMISYYFGTSSGSQSKDLLLFKSMPAPGTPAVQ